MSSNHQLILLNHKKFKKIPNLRTLKLKRTYAFFIDMYFGFFATYLIAVSYYHFSKAFLGTFYVINILTPTLFEPKSFSLFFGIYCLFTFSYFVIAHHFFGMTIGQKLNDLTPSSPLTITKLIKKIFYASMCGPVNLATMFFKNTFFLHDYLLNHYYFSNSEAYLKFINSESQNIEILFIDIEKLENETNKTEKNIEYEEKKAA